MSDRIVCEIINPSDAYSLVTDDFIAAAVAIAILGRGAYGLKSSELRTPVLMGWDDWFAENGIGDTESYIKANRLKMADALESVMIGSLAARADAESMLAMLSSDQKTKWLTERHDRRRSSMNDIGGAALRLAARFRETEATPNA